MNTQSVERKPFSGGTQDLPKFAQALELPDSQKPFLLYISEKGIVVGVFTQYLG